MIGVSDDRHLMTIAGSRAGKGVSTIIPNLIEYPGSILVIDPKGENAQITANRRGKGSRHVKEPLGQDVFVLDPFGVSGHETSHFNPLKMIDPKSPTAVDDAALVAEALVIQEEGAGRHFSAAARNFLRGLILFVSTDEDADSRNLHYVRQLLTLDQAAFKVLLEDMCGVDDDTWENCAGVIRGAANSLAAKSENERSGVLSTAIEQTDFLDSRPLIRTLVSSDFELRDLKRNRKGMTVYLCLPARFMATHSRWLRIIINLAVAAMEVEETKPEHPVLFLMDEFAVLDHLSSIEKAAGQIAGFHVRLWPILQDLSQLQSIYKGWETFMGNAGLLQFFGNNDLTTLQYIEKRLGKTTIVKESRAEALMEDTARGRHGVSVQLHETELMTADEVGRFFSRQSDAQLLMWPGADPIAIDRVQYHEPGGFFEGNYDPPKR
jgi:type IV secretion system protein VirD4